MRGKLGKDCTYLAFEKEGDLLFLCAKLKNELGGADKIRQKINAKIVAVWPEGKECHRESKLKKSKVVKLFEWNNGGLGRPKICLKIWTAIPLNKILKNMNIEISLMVRIILFLFWIIFMAAQVKIVGTKKYKESPKCVRVSNKDLDCEFIL